MSGNRKVAVSDAAVEVMVPLAKLMLGASMGVGDVVSLLKVAYVRAAVENMRSSRRGKPNVSRIAVETGMYRAEVSAILKQKARSPLPFRRGRARAERVLAGWFSDPEFLNDDGKPVALRMQGSAPSFEVLVERYGASNPQPILKELIRTGAVRERNETYQAVRSTCTQILWDKESIDEVGLQLQTHFEALLQNLDKPEDEPQFVRFFQSGPIDEMQARVLLRDLKGDGQLFMENATDRLSHKRYAANSANAEGSARQFSIGLQVVERVIDPGPSPAPRTGAGQKAAKLKKRAA